MFTRYGSAATFSMILTLVVTFGLARYVAVAPETVAGAPFQIMKQNFEWPSFCILDRKWDHGSLIAFHNKCWGPNPVEPTLFFRSDIEVSVFRSPVRPDLRGGKNPYLVGPRERPRPPLYVIPLLEPNHLRAIRISAPKLLIS